MRRLSTRETQITELLKDGLNSRQIGEILRISPNTVDKTIATVRLKLDARNRTQIVAKFDAMQRGR